MALMISHTSSSPVVRGEAGEDITVPAQRDYISYSAIRTYQQCPLRYYFRYVAGLPETSVAASLVFGSAIHCAVERHFQNLLQGGATHTVAELLAAYCSHWDEQALAVRFSKDETAAELNNLAERMLTAFIASVAATPGGRIVAVEETLRGPLIPGLPDVLARVDLIVETAEELVITDWKTSRSRFTADQVDDAAPQLLLYGALARDFVPGKRLRLELGVLTKTKDVQITRHDVPWDENAVARTQRIVARVWNAIQTGHH